MSILDLQGMQAPEKGGSNNAPAAGGSRASKNCVGSNLSLLLC
jgi:hypothetical protein